MSNEARPKEGSSVYEYKKPKATAAYVTLIQSPDYAVGQDYSALLKQYFTTPRQLRQGQIISIPSIMDYKFHERQGARVLGNIHEQPMIHWRVSKIEPNGQGIVCRNETNLYQSGVTQSFLTKTPGQNNHNYILGLNFDPYTLKDTLYFRRHAEEILDILRPIINNNLDFVGGILLYGDKGCGKRTLVRMAAQSLEMHLYHIDANDLIGDNPSATELKIKTAFTRSLSFAPCLIMLTNVDLFSYLNRHDLIRLEQNILENLQAINASREAWPLALIGVTSHDDLVEKSPLTSLFQYQQMLDCPTSSEQDDIFHCLMHEELPEQTNINLSSVIGASNLYLGDIMTLVSHVSLNIKSNCQVSNAVADLVLKAYEDIQERRGKTIATADVVKTSWQDVGGLHEVKKHIVDTIQLSIEYPQLSLSGLRRSGILLHGPPGTGKTLLAKAVATECGLNFISVKGPELINMYVGQSEENVRKLFQRAREVSPSVIFFDELDSLAPNRGQSGDSGGVMDRVVSQLLAEMDGVGRNQQVFVIGATNRLDLIDKSLLRPGRFDKIIQVPIPNDKESRIQILKAQTRHMTLENFDYEFLESRCPPGMSGADFYALCAGAANNAIARCIDEIRAGRATELDADITPTMEDFLSCLKPLIVHN